MKRVALILLVTLIPTYGAASSKELDAAIIQGLPFKSVLVPPSVRHTVAAAGWAYWKDFDSRVPRNPPKVMEWLKGEFDTTDLERLGRVISTPEYALWNLSEVSSKCVAVFSSLTNNIGGDPLTELYFWTKSLKCYESTSSMIDSLKQAGLSNGRADGPFHLMHFNL